MKTMFVNPSRKHKKRKKRSRRSNVSLANPSRRSRRRNVSLSNPRRRRRNAGISSFIQNPLILGNPRRKRSRRSNPLQLSVKGIGKALLSMGGGAAVGFALEEFINSKIPALDNDYANLAVGTAIRLAESMLAAKYLPTDMGMAAAGAIMSESVKRIYTTVAVGGLGATPTHADLAADLSDMDDILDDMEVSGF